MPVTIQLAPIGARHWSLVTTGEAREKQQGQGTAVQKDAKQPRRGPNETRQAARLEAARAPRFFLSRPWPPARRAQKQEGPLSLSMQQADARDKEASVHCTTCLRPRASRRPPPLRPTCPLSPPRGCLPFAKERDSNPTQRDGARDWAWASHWARKGRARLHSLHKTLTARDQVPFRDLRHHAGTPLPSLPRPTPSTQAGRRLAD